MVINGLCFECASVRVFFFFGVFVCVCRLAHFFGFVFYIFRGIEAGKLGVLNVAVFAAALYFARGPKVT